FPDAKFIFIKRKPLPNIRSMLKVGFYHDRKDMLWWKGKEVYSLKEKEMVRQWAQDNIPAFIAALQYYKVHETFEKEREGLKAHKNLLEIRIEDFIEHPKNTIAAILDNIGLSWDRNVEFYFKKNTIYNRDRKEAYYIACDLDDQVENIAMEGV